MPKTKKKEPSRKDLPILRIKPSTYQQSKAELEEDIIVADDPPEVFRTVLRPVHIQFGRD